MTRREALAGLTAAATGKRYRVAIIGHTGRGNYGHDWDAAWTGMPNVHVVAGADPVETGRQKAMARSGARKGYADYREMLGAERPDIVTIGPRWADQRTPMITAAAEIGAHMIVEKPFAASLEEADRLFEMTAHRGLK